MSPPTVVALGECMLEVRHGADGAAALAAGGDSYNTAVYLARAGAGAIAVSYATVLGTDPYSDDLLAAMRLEGLDTSLVERVDGRLPGLYLIRVDAHGERTFSYYRDASAARLLFATPGTQVLADGLGDFDWLYVTGITLAILDEPARDRLLDVVQRARARGTRVAFDTNYRAVLWPDAATARRNIDAFLATVDVALPSLDDEQALWGATSAIDVLTRLRAAGVGEVVLKQGRDGAVVISGDQQQEVAATPVEPVVDTTAAGDAFNGAYLAARMSGAEPVEATRHGCRLAGQVVGHPGAIAPAPERSADVDRQP